MEQNFTEPDVLHRNWVCGCICCRLFELYFVPVPLVKLQDGENECLKTEATATDFVFGPTEVQRRFDF